MPRRDAATGFLAGFAVFLLRDDALAGAAFLRVTFFAVAIAALSSLDWLVPNCTRSLPRRCRI